MKITKAHQSLLYKIVGSEAKGDSVMDDLQEYHRGREAATSEVDEPNFDVDQAIASFDYDPPDNPFQRGYLRGLIKSGYATVSSDWDGVLV